MSEDACADRGSSVVVFDFDGTLWRGDCVGDFLRWRLHSNPLRTLPTLLLLPLLWHWLRGPPTSLGRAACVLLWIATAGLNEGQFQRAIDRFAERYAADPRRWHASSTAAVDQHLRANDQVVIATAAFAPLARALLARRWKQLPAVGSSVRPWAGGWVVAHHLHGERKINALVDNGHCPP